MKWLRKALPFPMPMRVPRCVRLPVSAYLPGNTPFERQLPARGIGGFEPPVMDKNRHSMAAFLRKCRGYQTGIVGKWHLGLEWVTKKNGKPAVLDAESGHSNVDYGQPIRIGPSDFGFDYSFIHPASLDIPPYVFLENHRVLDPGVILTTEVYPTERKHGVFLDKKHSNDQAVYWEKGVWWRQGEMAPTFRVEDCLNEITGQGLALYRRQSAANPFFSVSAAGRPPYPPGYLRRSIQVNPERGCTEILSWIRSGGSAHKGAAPGAGMLENTLLIFARDNGAYWPEEEILLYGHDSNRGVRGQKGDVWDGGHRVPLIVSWPEGIQEQAAYPGLVSLTDLFATGCRLAGSKHTGRFGDGQLQFFYRYCRRDTDFRIPYRNGAPFLLRHVCHPDAGMEIRRRAGFGRLLALRSLAAGERWAKGQLYRIREDPEERDNLFFRIIHGW